MTIHKPVENCFSGRVKKTGKPVDNFRCIRAIHNPETVEKPGFSCKYRKKAVDNHVDNVEKMRSCPLRKMCIL